MVRGLGSDELNPTVRSQRPGKRVCTTRLCLSWGVTTDAPPGLSDRHWPMIVLHSLICFDAVTLRSARDG
ncbi:hypothetical protein N7510_003211 [Penicillium lagena]|uniref:uncharacterized protein n=1 Tax=Penicillium lagena TaxID=94218 RepID=UPI0025422A7A|nr:uncharacterized protein N7510_003211 [Penicillium lagena]KAJ5619227.1 hypothetical protein N7510_003211 [Penicillium lagena]